MKNYIRPNAEIAKFDVEDIISSSGVIVDANSLTGANAEMYKVYQDNSVAKNTNISVFTW